ncbi:Ribokinase-like protein [Schizopora paradoxa]|uniref:Ribokinase-like protein n=1 Tax=Schizopora paradoxa TaxID=27342 RepID=A0A0H2S8C7_9AGAM|nr:Ribokinase-like protein [Schizopora paradoxa]
MVGDPIHFVTLGLFIIDEFQEVDANGSLVRLQPQVGGNGLYASVGARIWLPPTQVGMVIEKGSDFPPRVQADLEKYGRDMWLFKSLPNQLTTRSMTTFRNNQREFKYLTARPPTTTKIINGTKFERARTVHFHCAPSEAISLVREMDCIPKWNPITVYEPHPLACNPAELPSLISILPRINILSPNSTEALALLSIKDAPSRSVIEGAAKFFLKYGVGPGGQGYVIIRCHDLGSYVACRQRGVWIDAYWTNNNARRVVDVTGAGNAYLGGLSAGLYYTHDVFEAALYATVSASYTIEQRGLPKLTRFWKTEKWNGDSPRKRLKNLKARHESRI